MQDKLNIFQVFTFKRALAQSKKKYHQCKHVFKEWLTSQQEYMNMLNFMVHQIRKIFVINLKIKEQIYQEIFRNVDTLYQLHKQFFNSFNQAFKTYDQIGFQFGNLLLKYIPRFENYIYYVRTLNERSNKILFLKEKGDLKNYKNILKTNEGQYSQTYGKGLISKLQIIELVQYLGKPFQRLCQYQLFLRRIISSTTSLNPDKIILEKALESLVAELSKINQKISQINTKKVGQLDEKYKSLANSSRIFLRQFGINYYLDGILLNGTLYVMNDILLLVNSDNKQVKRINLDSYSWFHRLSIGSNITNSMFVHGDKSHTFFFRLDDLKQFQKLFHSLKHQSSLKKSTKKSRKQLVYKPMYVTKFKQQTKFVIFMYLEGDKKGIYNFFTIQQIYKFSEYVRLHFQIPFKSLQQITNLPVSMFLIKTQFNDFQCQQISLCLYQYLEPFLNNPKLLDDPEILWMLKMRDYISWTEKHLQKQNQKIIEAVLQKERRIRFQEIDFHQQDLIEVDIYIGNQIIKTKIGKQQRAYSVVRRIFKKDIGFDFTLKIGYNVSQGYLIDDDQILYQVLCEADYSFKQNESILTKIMNHFQLTIKIFLVKYLFYEHVNKLFRICSQIRYRYLTIDILQRFYIDIHQLWSLSKGAEILAKILILWPQQNKKKNQLIKQFWNKKIKKQEVNEKYQYFYKKTMQQYQKKQKSNEQKSQTFKQLLPEIEYNNLYGYVTDCTESQKPYKLIIKYDALELRQKINSDIYLRIEHKNLLFKWTPSTIRIKSENKIYVIKAPWIYGIIMVLQRNKTYSQENQNKDDI